MKDTAAEFERDRRYFEELLVDIVARLKEPLEHRQAPQIEAVTRKIRHLELAERLGMGIRPFEFDILDRGAQGIQHTVIWSDPEGAGSGIVTMHSFLRHGNQLIDSIGDDERHEGRMKLLLIARRWVRSVKRCKCPSVYPAKSLMTPGDAEPVLARDPLWRELLYRAERLRSDAAARGSGFAVDNSPDWVRKLNTLAVYDGLATDPLISVRIAKGGLQIGASLSGRRGGVATVLPFIANGRLSEASIDTMAAALEEWMELRAAQLRAQVTPVTQDDLAPDSVGGSSARQESESKNTFFQSGAVWQVCFEDRSTMVADSEGLQYLQQLIGSQGKPIHVSTLAQDRMPPAAPQEAVDERAMSSMQRAAQELAEEFKLASDAGDDVRAAELAAKAIEHGEFVRQVRGKRGKARAFGDRIDKLRQRTGRAINRAIAAIERVHEPLGKHLRESIATPTGRNPCYRPKEPVSWVVGLGPVSQRSGQ